MTKMSDTSQVSDIYFPGGLGVLGGSIPNHFADQCSHMSNQ